MRATGALLLIFPLTGCVSTETRQLYQILTPPEDLDSALIDAGIYHNVSFKVELSSADLPPRGVLARIIPDRRATSEIYSVLGIHDVVFTNGMFEVGGARYPPRPKGRLYVFKKRRGNLEFAYRTQRIIVEGEGYWVPSFYFSVARQRGSRGGYDPGWRTETLQVGRAKIETDSRKDHWLVNGRTFKPSPDRPLILERGVTGFASN